MSKIKIENQSTRQDHLISWVAMRLEIVQSDALDGARNWSTSIDPTIDPTIRGSNLCAKAISCTTACDRRAMKRNH